MDNPTQGHKCHDSKSPSTDLDREFEAARFNTAVVYCLDKLDLLTMRLRRFPLEVMAVAAGTYFDELLCVLVSEQVWSADDVRGFLRKIECDVLGDSASEVAPRAETPEEVSSGGATGS